MTKLALLAAPLFVGALATGCAVPQPPGTGRATYELDPRSGRHYFEYLPDDYVNATDEQRAQRHWPLVVTFHGMKPYDTSIFQIREWEQEADRYGFIVIAPELLAFDMIIGEFPQNSISLLFKSDEQATLSIMDHVCETTQADCENVLATGFSSGGYLAHYMLNRHPDRFSCLAARQANFSAAVLDSSETVKSRNSPVLVMNAEHDMPICVEESKEAVRWYEVHGYKKLAWLYIRDLAHERTPDVAAAFFARSAGVVARTPPAVMTNRRALAGNATGRALLAGEFSGNAPPSGVRTAEADTSAPVAKPVTPRRPVETAVRTEKPKPAPAPAPEPEPPPPPTPKRGEAPPSKPRTTPVAIKLSTAAGYAPLTLSYAADTPAEWQSSGRFEWRLDGQKIGDGPRGERTLSDAGEYVIELLVVAKDGTEYRASQSVRVLRAVEPVRDGSR